MKQKLIALLRTSFASKGFNAKELESLADLVIAQNLITEESTEEDLSAAVTAAKPTADFVQSVASRQVTDAKKPKVEEPAKPVVPAVEPEIPTTTDPVLLALLAEIKEMKTGLTNLNAEKVANTRRDLYAAGLKGTPKEYQERELKKFDKMKFDTQEEFDEFMDESKDFHADAIQEDVNAGIGNERPAGGAGGNPAGAPKVIAEADLDAIMNAI